jgi:hypothetical protein
MMHLEVVLARLGLAVKYPSDPAAGTVADVGAVDRPLQDGVRPGGAFPAAAAAELKLSVAAAGGGVAAVGSDAAAGLARGLWIPSRSSRIPCTSVRETAPRSNPRSVCTRTT